MLPYLPPMVGHATGARVDNGPALAGYGAEAAREAVAEKIATLPDHVRKSLTWDQDAKMAQHLQLRVETGLAIYLAIPGVRGSELQREHKRLTAPIRPLRRRYE